MRETKTKRQHSDSTLAFWEPRSSREITTEDVRVIRENLAGFFELLQRWRAQADKRSRPRRRGPGRLVNLLPHCD